MQPPTAGVGGAASGAGGGVGVVALPPGIMCSPRQGDISFNSLRKGNSTTTNKTPTFDLKAVAAGLLLQGMSEDEVTSKMEAIMAVIDS